MLGAAYAVIDRGQPQPSAPTSEWHHTPSWHRRHRQAAGAAAGQAADLVRGPQDHACIGKALLGDCRGSARHGELGETVGGYDK